MIGVSFYRVFRSAFINFWRNFWLSMAMAIIMTITLLMVTMLYFANVFGSEVLHAIQQKVDLSVTFKENVQDQYILAVARELENRQDVDKVTVVTSEQALAEFRRRNQDEPTIEESLQELEENPLPASIFIIATEPRFYENIANYLRSDKFAPFISKVNFEKSQTVINKLITLISSIKNIGIVVTIVFSLLVILITFNTVRLAIYSFREEIDIMRLVGASRWFITGPFVMETVLISLIAVGIATGITYPSLHAIAPHLKRFFFDAQSAQFDIYAHATSHWLTIVSLQAAVAVGLAFISSSIAIRRYLKD